MEGLRGNKVLTGAWGEIWIDGSKVAEIEKVEVKVTVEREDVQIGLDMDTKIKAIKGEITISMKKVYSRFNDILTTLVKGNDIRSQVITKLADPNAVGGQQERVSIDNVWWNDLPVGGFEVGAVSKQELTGGFTASDLKFLDLIKVQ